MNSFPLLRPGELTTAALLISILSGFVVAYQFEPAIPFESTTAIEAIIPWGYFWRGIHFWSSQAFFLLLIWHTWDKACDIGDAMPLRQKISWSVVSSTLFFGLYALFSGYVLRYDGTGQAAGAIAEHLMLSIPLAGPLVDRFLLAISSDGVNRLYAVHILMGGLCWGVGVWYHTRRVILSGRAFLQLLVLLVFISLMVHVPLEFQTESSSLITGPWFFMGIQEMLRSMDLFFAGVLFPALPIIMVALLPWIGRRVVVPLFFLFWTVFYFLTLFMALLRSE